MSDRFYRERTGEVILTMRVTDAKALRNQLRSIENPPVIVTHVLAVLAQQIAEADAS